MNARQLYSHWNEARENLYRALDMLTDEQLHFVPGEGLWSLGTVVTHIARAEDSWMRCAIVGAVAEWPKGRYAFEDYASVGALKALLAEVHERTLAFLETVELEDLDRPVGVMRETTTLGWIIWHVLDHEIHHRGEVFLMLGLMGMEAPDI